MKDDAILNAFIDTGCAMTVRDVYDETKGEFSISTIIRTINRYVDDGLLLKMNKKNVKKGRPSTYFCISCKGLKMTGNIPEDDPVPTEPKGRTVDDLYEPLKMSKVEQMANDSGHQVVCFANDIIRKIRNFDEKVYVYFINTYVKFCEDKSRLNAIALEDAREGLFGGRSEPMSDDLKWAIARYRVMLSLM